MSKDDCNYTKKIRIGLLLILGRKCRVFDLFFLKG